MIEIKELNDAVQSQIQYVRATLFNRSSTDEELTLANKALVNISLLLSNILESLSSQISKDISQNRFSSLVEQIKKENKNLSPEEKQEKIRNIINNGQ